MATIQKYTTKSGQLRYRVMWRDGMKQKSKSFDRSKSATEFKIKLEHDLRQGSYVEPIKITVREYLEQWFEVHSKALAYNTIQDYRYVTKHINKHIGGAYLQKLHAGDIEIMYKRLSVNLSGKYIRNIHSMLNTALKAAVRNRQLTSNPCDLLDAPKIKEKFEASFIPPESVSEYVNLYKGYWIQPAVAISLMCGLRRGELLALKWKDISFTKNTIHVKQSSYFDHSTNMIIDKAPKSGKPRMVFMPNELNVFLKNLKREQKKQKIAIGYLYNDSDYVLVENNGNRPRPDTVSSTFARKLKKSNLPYIRFHDLRHTAGSLMILEGHDLKTVSEVLGHASIAITADIYIHIINEMKKKAADSVGKYLNSI